MHPATARRHRSGSIRMRFVRQEHEIIADLLDRLDHRLLLENRCWFGGGTAIVLKLREYRRSLDVYFLCSSIEGYREVRNAVVEGGADALFVAGVASAREPRTDQYGIRTFLSHRGLAIKLEIVREARIDLDGAMDENLRVPVLCRQDLFAEKLLANADRCMDRATSYRDAIDLGMLVEAYGAIPDVAVEKAAGAYGADIGRKARWVVERLQRKGELHQAAGNLQMEHSVAAAAIEAFAAECRRLWPGSGQDQP